MSLRIIKENRSLLAALAITWVCMIVEKGTSRFVNIKHGIFPALLISTVRLLKSSMAEEYPWDNEIYGASYYFRNSLHEMKYFGDT